MRLFYVEVTIYLTFEAESELPQSVRYYVIYTIFELNRLEIPLASSTSFSAAAAILILYSETFVKPTPHT